MPVTVVPTSSATVAIDTFITEESSVIRNCAVARVSSTVVEAALGLARSVPVATPSSIPLPRSAVEPVDDVGVLRRDGLAAQLEGRGQLVAARLPVRRQ